MSRENSVFAASAHQHHLLLYPLSFTSRRCELGVVYLLAGEKSVGYRDTGSEVSRRSGRGQGRNQGDEERTV